MWGPPPIRPLTGRERCPTIWVTGHPYYGREESQVVRISDEERARVRERLLAAAAQRFAEDGFERANINTISRQAGLAKGTVYNYFASKEELFGEVIRAAARRAVALWSRAPAGSSLEGCLRALAAADVQVLREREPFVKVLVREAFAFRPATYPLILEHMAPFLEAVGRCLERGAARGDLRGDLPPERLALLFVGILGLLYVQHWGTGGAWPALDEIPDLAATLFLHGAAPPRRGRP
ncbi:MAG: TetR/AcrR family transcriptional regulator [Nitrospirae bacterium]|nr:MAG: TetR/AcrR family transcriptional regulator [Nitrospirota bacterium]